MDSVVALAQAVPMKSTAVAADSSGGAEESTVNSPGGSVIPQQTSVD